MNKEIVKGSDNNYYIKTDVYYWDDEDETVYTELGEYDYNEIICNENNYDIVFVPISK